MEKVSVSKEFVLAAHKAAQGINCNEWINKIEKEFPELFKEQFKAGQWVEWMGRNSVIGRIVERDHSYKDCYALDVDGNKNSHNSCHYKRLRLLEPSEIETHLIALAEKKGYKEGVKFKSVTNGTVGKCGKASDLVYGGDGILDWPTLNPGNIYHNGEWATIIEEPKVIELTLEDIAKLKGCEVSQIKIVK